MNARHTTILTDTAGEEVGRIVDDRDPADLSDEDLTNDAFDEDLANEVSVGITENADEVPTDTQEVPTDTQEVPQLAAWWNLVDDVEEIREYPDGDASKHPGMPKRPAWSAPPSDVITGTASGMYYSAPASVRCIDHPGAKNDHGAIAFAYLDVRACMNSSGDVGVRVFHKAPKVRPGGLRFDWTSTFKFEVQPDEARALGLRLIAAADLAESEQVVTPMPD